MFGRLVIPCVLALCLCRGAEVEVTRSLKVLATCTIPLRSILTVTINGNLGQDICLPMMIRDGGEFQDYLGVILELSGIDVDDNNISVSYNTTGGESFVQRDSCLDLRNNESDLVVILTNSTFDVLVDDELLVTIGEEMFTVRYFSQGFHLLRGNMFNISEIGDTAILFGLYITEPVTSLSICRRNVIDGGTVEYSDAKAIFNLFSPMPTMAQPCTLPDQVNVLTAFYVLERNTGNISDLDPTYELVISTITSCSLLRDSGPGEQFTSEVITITVYNPSTDPPTESPTTSTTPGDGDGGGSNHNVAAIASGVGGTVIVAFAVLVGVTMYFKKYPFKIRRRNERRPGEEGGEQVPLKNIEQGSTPPPEVHENNRPTTSAKKEPEDKTVMVWDLAHVDPELVDLLALKEDAKGKRFPDPQNNEMSLENQVYSTLRKPHCVRLYIFYEDSPEQLNNGNRKAWEVVRNLQTRPLRTEQLSKVVLVRVHRDSSDKVSDTVEGPVLTVNLHRNCLQESVKTSANLICSRARINQQQTTIDDSIDGSMRSVQNSQEPSPTPTPTSPHPITSLPSYSSTAPPNQNVLSPIQPPQPVAGNGEILGALKDLNKNVIKLTKINQDIADNTGRAADNTDGMGEKMDEIASGQIQLEEIAQNNLMLPEAEENT